MFFFLGNECNLLTKKCENLFTDKGWRQQDNVYYKGYCLDYELNDNIHQILSGDTPQGIYAVIQDNNVFHSYMRPFPLYKSLSGITNLKLDGFDEVPNTKYKLPDSEMVLSQVVSSVIDIVSENLSKVELNIWCTGGVDSMMLVAIAEYAGLPYTICFSKTNKVASYDSSLLTFCREKYWAYNFLSVFDNKTITTGFYGDEYFCRSVWQINLLANAYNKVGTDVVSYKDYVYYYLFKHRKDQILTNGITLDNVKFTTLNTIGTGHAWHIDNTITFCPLMDKRIVEKVWSLDPSSLLNYAVDATIQKEIILSTTPDVMMLVDKYKNYSSGQSNLLKNLNKVKMPNCKGIECY